MQSPRSRQGGRRPADGSAPAVPLVALLLLVLNAPPGAAQTQTGQGPQAPQPAFPFQEMQILNPGLKFLWMSTQPAQELLGFELQIGREEDFRKTVYDKSFRAEPRPSGIYEFSPPPSTYANLTRYYWRVRAQDRLGRWGPYSEVRIFDTFFGPPEIFPLQRLPGEEPTFQTPFTASYSFEPYSKSVSGDESRSFVPSGVFSVHKLGLAFSRPVKGVHVESNLDFQYTDDPQLVQDKKKAQFLGGYASVEKPQRFKASLGDLSADLSQATLSSSLRGLTGEVHWGEASTRLDLAAGQVLPAEEGSQFERFAGGIKLGRSVSAGRAKLLMQASYARGEDRLDSLADRTGIPQLSMNAYSLNLGLSHPSGLELEAEAARSQGELRGDRGRFEGDSFRASPRYRLGNVRLSANAARSSPGYFNPLGGGSADTLRLDGDVSTTFGANSLGLRYGFNRNNVEHTQASTSFSHSYGANLNLSPFKGMGGRLEATTLGLQGQQSDSIVTGGVLRTQNRSYGFGPTYREGSLSLSMRVNHTTTRDLRKPENDRNGLEASGQMGYSYKPSEGVVLDPALSLSWSQGRRLATDTVNTNQNAALNLNSTFGKSTLSGSLSWQWLKEPFAGRRSTQNQLQLNYQLDLEPGAPGSLSFSLSRRLFRDSRQPKTVETELRGGLNLKI